MKKIALGLSLLLTQSSAWSLTFKPVVHADARGGYAATVDSKGSLLGLGNLFVVPALGLSEKINLLPTIYITATGQERSIQEDTLFVRGLVSGFRPTLKFSQSEDSTYSLRLDARRSMNVETVNEPFGKGLYDFDEFVAGADWDGIVLELPVGIGVDASARNYPNYRRLGSELTRGLNARVKDFVGVQTSLKATLKPVGKISVSLWFKNYDDAYVTRVLDGTLDLERRQADLYTTVGLDGETSLNPAWGLGWGLQWISNSSNQNTFDTINNKALPNSQDYQVTRANTDLRWANEAWKASIGYSVSLRNLNRPVQTPSGALTSAKISDVENGLNLSLSHKLGGGLSWLNSASARYVSSNQQFESGIKPNYSFYNVTTGLSWDWQGQ